MTVEQVDARGQQSGPPPLAADVLSSTADSDVLKSFVLAARVGCSRRTGARPLPSTGHGCVQDRCAALARPGFPAGARVRWLPPGLLGGVSRLGPRRWAACWQHAARPRNRITPEEPVRGLTRALVPRTSLTPAWVHGSAGRGARAQGSVAACGRRTARGVAPPRFRPSMSATPSRTRPHSQAEQMHDDVPSDEGTNYRLDPPGSSSADDKGSVPIFSASRRRAWASPRRMRRGGPGEHDTVGWSSPITLVKTIIAGPSPAGSEARIGTRRWCSR